MSKLYSTIQTDLVDPELEAKINPEVVNEPVLQDVPTNLYAAITSNKTEASGEVDTTSPEAKTFSYSVSPRLYTQLVPEKPNILAEERIFVYVPKVAYNRPGIARFATNQFNIVDGQVSIKQSFLVNLILGQLTNLDLIKVVPILPAVGVENKIYLVPNLNNEFVGYVWSDLTKTWTSLGIIAITANFTNNFAIYNSVTDADAANHADGDYVIVKI